MNQLDERVCEHIAEEWISLGCDAEGFSFLWGRILEILKEKEGANAS